jgi:hypothetical protein
MRYNLRAKSVDRRLKKDGIYLLSARAGHLDDGVPIEVCTFFKVEGGLLFGCKQALGPITTMRENPTEQLDSLAWVDLDDPAGLVNLLRSPGAKLERVKR